MLERSKKHANKILVFLLNFLLMAIAVLVIKQREDSKKSAQVQDELKNNNSFLNEENTKLNNDLQSLKGVLGTLESRVLMQEDAPTSNGDSSNNTDNSTTSTPAARGTNITPRQAIPSTSAANILPAPAMPSSNSRTKTS